MLQVSLHSRSRSAGHDVSVPLHDLARHAEKSASTKLKSSVSRQKPLTKRAQPRLGLFLRRTLTRFSGGVRRPRLNTSEPFVGSGDDRITSWRQGDAAKLLDRCKLTGRRSKSTGRLLYCLWWAPGCLWGDPGLIQNLFLQGLIDVGFDQILKRISRLLVFTPAVPRPLLW